MTHRHFLLLAALGLAISTLSAQTLIPWLGVWASLYQNKVYGLDGKLLLDSIAYSQVNPYKTYPDHHAERTMEEMIEKF